MKESTLNSLVVLVLLVIALIIGSAFVLLDSSAHPVVETLTDDQVRDAELTAQIMTDNPFQRLIYRKPQIIEKDEDVYAIWKTWWGLSTNHCQRIDFVEMNGEKFVKGGGGVSCADVME